MKKIILGTAILATLFFSGCNENTEEIAKEEFKQKIFSIKITKNDFNEQAEAILKDYEKKYGFIANVWLEELSKTDKWNAMERKSRDSVKNVMPDYSNLK